jgi:hypothetical protein
MKFRYKEYTPEENRKYSEAMPKIIEKLQSGACFQEACDTISVENQELRDFIVDDALKMMIAEIHYIQGHPLQAVADKLCISLDTVNRANQEMLEDVSLTAPEIYHLNNPDEQFGNA